MKLVKKLIILELHCWANKNQELNMMNLEDQCKYACLLIIMFIHTHQKTYVIILIYTT